LAYRIVIVQLVAALVAVLSMSLVVAEQAQQALAAAMGSLACILPTAAFAVCASRCRTPSQVLLAGIIKPIAIVGLMVLAFVMVNPAPLGFFVGLGAAYVAYLAAPFLGRRATSSS